MDVLDVVQDASEDLGKMFTDTVKQRNREGVRSLVLGQKHVLWGKYFRELSEEDRTWVLENIE